MSAVIGSRSLMTLCLLLALSSFDGYHGSLVHYASDHSARAIDGSAGSFIAAEEQHTVGSVTQAGTQSRAWLEADQARSRPGETQLTTQQSQLRASAQPFLPRLPSAPHPVSRNVPHQHRPTTRKNRTHARSQHLGYNPYQMDVMKQDTSLGPWHWAFQTTSPPQAWNHPTHLNPSDPALGFQSAESYRTMGIKRYDTEQGNGAKKNQYVPEDATHHPDYYKLPKDFLLDPVLDHRPDSSFGKDHPGNSEVENIVPKDATNHPDHSIPPEESLVDPISRLPDDLFDDHPGNSEVRNYVPEDATNHPDHSIPSEESLVDLISLLPNGFFDDHPGNNEVKNTVLENSLESGKISSPQFKNFRKHIELNQLFDIDNQGIDKSRETFAQVPKQQRGHQELYRPPPLRNRRA
ncbi:hypothetical protein Pst134EA_027904 [Puccinia striiformis f. sp. tritici]|uniref:hypothetical protein n=1 Tax=Puccinia striiformis f. sp. tritici TaxID=168172 RepID=UPI0020088562|nr:hypothetical protein Pst134EA_027904 [Puccinia striiformis f. sp. tritici]KAH9448599.1 hypothetical protein Pst134EA_027904 [Puccinia striiformis f. sp. tritici]